MQRLRLLFICLCEVSTAFVSIPVPPLCCTQALVAAGRKSARSPTATGLPPSSSSAAPCRPTAVSSRRWQRAISRAFGDVEGEDVDVIVDGAGAALEDPFRPERASVAPTVINMLVPVLFKLDTEAAEAAAAVLEQRRRSSDWQLTEEEARAATNRVFGVASNLTELRFMLATAVRRTPSIAKYGLLSDYGMSDDVEDNPLAQMNQAECLLALYMLHKEKVGVAAVDFLDADRLEVLK